MEQLLSLPFCGILVTVACYMIGLLIKKLLPSPLTNPMIIATVLIVLILMYTPLTLEQYLEGGSIITMFIGPATVILALRIYRRRSQLKEHILPVLGGCLAGSLASIASVWGFCKLLDLDRVITVSLIPKSVTTAIAIELAEKNGGITGLAVSAVIVTGIASGTFSPFFIKIFRLNDPFAAGIAIGASGHAIGTATAFELGEIEGAMSGLAMGIVGIITSVICIFLL